MFLSALRPHFQLFEGVRELVRFSPGIRDFRVAGRTWRSRRRNSDRQTATTERGPPKFPDVPQFPDALNYFCSESTRASSSLAQHGSTGTSFFADAGSASASAGGFGAVGGPHAAERERGFRHGRGRVSVVSGTFATLHRGGTPQGSHQAHLETLLFANTSAWGKAEWEAKPEHGAAKREHGAQQQKFEVEIFDATPANQYNVLVDGINVGSVTVDPSGMGKLEFKTNAEADELPFPNHFPAVQAGTVVPVQGLVTERFSSVPHGS